MKKKEIVRIMEPYWAEYLKNNGEFERKLQLDKFIENCKRFQGLSYLFMNPLKYMLFKFKLKLTRRFFWKMTQQITELKKSELTLGSILEEHKKYFTEAEISEMSDKKKKAAEGFNEYLKDYFQITLGAPERETRMLTAHEVIKHIKI